MAINYYWSVQDKTIVITGCVPVLEVDYVNFLLCRGAKCVALLDNEGTPETGSKAVAEVLNRIHTDKVVFIECDVNNEEDLTKAFEAVLSQFKQIDLIINIAGLNFSSARGPYEVNWQSMGFLTRKAIEHMRIDEGGKGGIILNIVPLIGCVQFPHKIEMIHFSQCLAMDFYENTLVKVMTMCLGPSDSRDVFESSSYESNLDKIEIYMAARCFLEMFENGTPGSIWMTMDNNPVKDLTPNIDSVFIKLLGSL